MIKMLNVKEIEPEFSNVEIFLDISKKPGNMSGSGAGPLPERFWKQ